jgi:anaerobic magnesium-protoporphyrin IX monomethyl ester cyclase
MKVALVGAELEENLGLRYMAAALEAKGHQVELVPFNAERDLLRVAEFICDSAPQITGFSMVFTGRAMEFCRLAQDLRNQGYRGHLIAGGHFASLNCERLLQEFPAFDSVGLGEGEHIICALADHIDDPSRVSGLCYRKADGSIGINPSSGNPDNLDALPFPKRTTFHDYYGKPIASILSTRGCYRDCAFCSINAWYKQGGGKKFRLRSIENVVAEMKDLYVNHGVRIFNFQDDNFFHPRNEVAVERFAALREALQREGVANIAIAVKARPDSITPEAIQVLDDLGLFRVFLGVENASERGLRHLNRKCTLDHILNSLRILNDFDIHVSYNLLMFEPDTELADILINLRFMERHMDNPFNFCRAEVYAGTGLEAKLLSENRLLGDYRGFDYRIKDPYAEAFHQIANYAFFDRNFSDFGLHYFNMQVDFCFQVLRRFFPQVLTQTLRSAVKNFIKETNLDTYQYLSRIYDFVAAGDPHDYFHIRSFAKQMREQVDFRSRELKAKGEVILRGLEEATAVQDQPLAWTPLPPARAGMIQNVPPVPYEGPASLKKWDFLAPDLGWVDGIQTFGLSPGAIPYTVFKESLASQQEERR